VEFNLDKDLKKKKYNEKVVPKQINTISLISKELIIKELESEFEDDCSFSYYEELIE